MATGLQVFDKNGIMVLDTSGTSVFHSRICKILGTGATGFDAGVITNPNIYGAERNRLWVMPLKIQFAEGFTSVNRVSAPEFSISNGAIRWVFYGSDKRERMAMNFIYGVY